MAEHRRQGREMTLDRHKRPENYIVILHNDDFTTMDFVVRVLRQVFFMPEAEALEIMMSVHENGTGVAGSYVYDIARSKAQMTMRMARAEGFPLQVTIEKDELSF